MLCGSIALPNYSEYLVHRSRRPIWIAVSCCCLALLLSCALGMLSVQQRWVALPAFGARLGPFWLTSCLPRWEMISSLGCISDNGDFRRPSEIWLEVDAPPYGNRRMYRLLSILPDPG
jgi:hypothetical protein